MWKRSFTANVNVEAENLAAESDIFISVLQLESLKG
jgi:hypothetical protein